ncbi:MAG: hypothetical protein ACREP9_10165 [Candidatus Dormibacteraceae bacterium]
MTGYRYYSPVQAVKKILKIITISIIILSILAYLIFVLAIIPNVHSLHFLVGPWEATYIIGPMILGVVFGYRRPVFRFNDNLIRALNRWNKDHSNDIRDWTMLEMPPVQEGEKPPPEMAAQLCRFSGNPPFSFNPASGTGPHWIHHWIPEAARPEVSDVAVIASRIYEYATPKKFIFFRNQRLTRQTQTNYLAVSLERPTVMPRLAIYRLNSYRKIPCYRWIAFWRLRTGVAQFDRRFHVEAANRTHAKMVLRPQLAEWLANHPLTMHFGLTFENGTLNAWLTGNFPFDPALLNPLTSCLIGISERIPASASKHPTSKN